MISPKSFSLSRFFPVGSDLPVHPYVTLTTVFTRFNQVNLSSGSLLYDQSDYPSCCYILRQGQVENSHAPIFTIFRKTKKNVCIKRGTLDEPTQVRLEKDFNKTDAHTKLTEKDLDRFVHSLRLFNRSFQFASTFASRHHSLLLVEFTDAHKALPKCSTIATPPPILNP
jgi:hypothetical protein